MTRFSEATQDLAAKASGLLSHELLKEQVAALEDVLRQPDAPNPEGLRQYINAVIGLESARLSALAALRPAVDAIDMLARRERLDRERERRDLLRGAATMLEERLQRIIDKTDGIDFGYADVLAKDPHWAPMVDENPILRQMASMRTTLKDALSLAKRVRSECSAPL